MALFFDRLYGTIAVAVVVIVVIIYSRIQKSLKHKSLMDNYELQVQNMTDNQLRNETQSLAYKHKHQLDLPDDDILGANPFADIDQMYKIALAELNRRNLVN